jgi:hypothetical protein
LHFAGEGSGAVSISATNFVSLAPGFTRGEGNETGNEGNIRGAGLASIGQLIEGCELGRSMKKGPWQPLFTRRGLLSRSCHLRDYVSTDGRFTSAHTKV